MSEQTHTHAHCMQAATDESCGGGARREEERKVKKKKKDKGKVKLSFAGDDGDLDEEDGSFAAPSRKKDSKDGTPDESEDGASLPFSPFEEDALLQIRDISLIFVRNVARRTARAAKRAKLGRNPTVDTHFLPDREREEAERRERDELRKKWLKMQEDMKQEPVEITYSYWDGSGHRKEVTVSSVRTPFRFRQRKKDLRILIRKPFVRHPGSARRATRSRSSLRNADNSSRNCAPSRSTTSCTSRRI